ncbi:DEAD/DEAH box helicase family protein [Campylobacter geochelonis]|uniref:Type III restriction-modification enzyme n=1 Tax=Campylobacter geochelonis TaxID=1780362 RepID=A0A128EI23_9BACT|nr:DEAD/DEAH box helicase family protein [Campylobacter geochelonis]QKF71529.1 type III restriction/modification system, restriction subunit [Campylobacter geochelonis]CZE48494.1 type III restriction-modification enzyme [Campylobacter geochelonis]
MTDKFLYESLNNDIVDELISEIELPKCIGDNLKFSIREYQTKAFKRYVYLYKKGFNVSKKQTLKRPVHLLFNMATGSGKTLVMAGIILYLYEKGYRNFLFFVNSTNIIQKTKDNFLNQFASKYLFKDKIIINNKEIFIKDIENFDGSDMDNINIKFTTIQGLHVDLNNIKENSITYEDFENKKIVLIADEAHHINATTKSKQKTFDELIPSWENTVEKIHKSNYENIMLEFTATMDFSNENIKNKYLDKVLYKYDLKEFRLDGYSKEIHLFKSNYDEKERIIQALILNLYRAEIATMNGINLKPVVLFKAKSTIKESQDNKEKFHNLIDEFDFKVVDKFRKQNKIEIIEKAFKFFDKKQISSSEISKRIKSNFKFENCLSANNDEEAEKNQILLNTLEDENNPIRAIFSVQKLNEGWDVLNLFDIVRLYEGQNTGGANKDRIGNTTLSEAQLIGRGARYFPFSLDVKENKFKRKYDNDIDSDLKILEELYYHAKDESRYISELKTALVSSGIYEDEEDMQIKELKLKMDFKQSLFYKKAFVFFNKKIEKSYDNVKSFADLDVKKRNFTFKISSEYGKVAAVFDEKNYQKEQSNLSKIDVGLKEIPLHIVRFALSKNPFFYHDNLTKFFPNLSSILEFIQNDEYLGGLEITFSGINIHKEKIKNNEYLNAIIKLLSEVESDINANLSKFEGSSEYEKALISKVFIDKKLKINKNNERINGQEEFIKDKPWYAYDANFGTTEEKNFVELFARRFNGLKKKFDDIYLIRNERVVRIYDRLGRTFEPDFLLFCKKKDKNDSLTYQVFIEPKGLHLKDYDKWKEDFLHVIADKKNSLKINTDEYLITALPFYNQSDENEFSISLNKALNI